MICLRVLGWDVSSILIFDEFDELLLDKNYIVRGQSLMDIWVRNFSI